MVHPPTNHRTNRLQEKNEEKSLQWYYRCLLLMKHLTIDRFYCRTKFPHEHWLHLNARKSIKRRDLSCLPSRRNGTRWHRSSNRNSHFQTAPRRVIISCPRWSRGAPINKLNTKKMFISASINLYLDRWIANE